jgi:hypothetical protein
MKVTGGCHCGHIRYEADLDPDRVGICHCTDCQRLSGSAFRTIALTFDDDFKLLSGDLREYVKTAESGNQRIQTFCPNCGSPIYSTSVSEARKEYSVRLGTVRERDQLKPKFQLWRRSSQDWLHGIDQIPGTEKE